MIFQFSLTQPGGQITQVMWTLQQWGLLDALLPFLLFFAIIFATLQKIKIFTKGQAPDRKMNGVIAFVIAAMVVVPHITRSYPQQFDPVYILLNILPSAGLLLLTLFITLVLIGLTAKDGGPHSIHQVVGFVFLIILGGVIVTAIWPAFTPSWLNLDPNMTALIITLLMFGGVVWFIARDDTPANPPDSGGFLNWLKKMYGG